MAASAIALKPSNRPPDSEILRSVAKGRQVRVAQGMQMCSHNSGDKLYAGTPTYSVTSQIQSRPAAILNLCIFFIIIFLILKATSLVIFLRIKRERERECEVFSGTNSQDSAFSAVSGVL